MSAVSRAAALQLDQATLSFQNRLPQGGAGLSLHSISCPLSVLSLFSFENEIESLPFVGALIPADHDAKCTSTLASMKIQQISDVRLQAARRSFLHLILI